MAAKTPPTNQTSQFPLGNSSDDPDYAGWRQMWPQRDALRDYVRSWRGSRTASAASQEQYAQRYAHAEAGHSTLATARTKSTWHMTKAAYTHMLSTFIEDAISMADQMDRSGNFAGARRMIVQAVADKTRLDEIRAAPVPKHLKNHKSKRTLVAKMREDFPDQYMLAASDQTLKNALAALGVGGFRPAEFDMAHGVHVSRRGDLLVLRVLGAKCKGDRQGLEWRELSVQPKSACAMHLFQQCAAAPLTIQIPSGQWLTDKVRSLGRLLDNRSDVTPYVWRHRLAIQLKKDESGDPEGIAIAMGHAAVKTQGRYGFRGGKSFYCPDKIISIKGSKSRAEIRPLPVKKGFTRR